MYANSRRHRGMWPPLLVALLFLAQCGATRPEPSATAPSTDVPAPLISEAVARQLAVEAAALGGPELSPAQGTPEIRTLTQTTWQAVQEEYGTDMPSIAALAPSSEVWVAELTGEWFGGMPAPGITPTPECYTLAVVVLDARTGVVITTLHQP